MALPSALENRRFRFHVWISAVLILILIIVAFFPPTFQFGVGVYLPVHTAMEVFSILVAALVFIVSWNSNDETRAGTTSLLGCAFLAVALINFGHVLSYSGMPDLVTPASPEKAINFSLVTRFIAALALLGIAFLPWRSLASSMVKYVYLALTLALVVIVFWIGLYRSEWMPATFRPGHGLTAFKIAAEYVMVVLHIGGCIGFYRRFLRDNDSAASYLFAASAIMVASQVFNTFYVHPYDIYNLLSHVYRVVAYILIYRGILLSAIREPYQLANRLRGELNESTMRLRDMSARVRMDVEAERKRIARSMHDEMGQDLLALRMDLDWLQHRYPDHGGIKDVSNRMRTTIENSATAMRRIISDMRPLILDDLGIAAALHALTVDFKTRAQIDLKSIVDGSFEDLTDNQQTALYRIVQESLTNIARHSHATKVEIVLRRDFDSVTLSISDNGVGFDRAARNKKGSFGLFGMSERMLELDGSLSVETASGEGTRIVVRIPVAQRHVTQLSAVETGFSS
jgi:signal transduction histidine kinase